MFSEGHEEDERGNSGASRGGKGLGNRSQRRWCLAAESAQGPLLIHPVCFLSCAAVPRGSACCPVAGLLCSYHARPFTGLSWPLFVFCCQHLMGFRALGSQPQASPLDDSIVSGTQESLVVKPGLCLGCWTTC